MVCSSKQNTEAAEKVDRMGSVAAHVACLRWFKKASGAAAGARVLFTAPCSSTRGKGGFQPQTAVGDGGR
jgi:hypothetical protein